MSLSLITLKYRDFDSNVKTQIKLGGGGHRAIYTLVHYFSLQFEAHFIKNG